MPDRPPSFLIFVVDQLPARHLGCFGHPAARTPAIDRLAGDAGVFHRAYVANPVCMPNRATIATGRWPASHGTHTNGITLDPDSATFMRSLRNAGWDTVAVGKLHFQTMGWPWEPFQLEEFARTSPLLIDPDGRDAVIRDRPAGWDRYEEADRHRAGYVPLGPDYYGFDHVDLVVGHGDRGTGHYTTWARERGLDPEQISGVTHATRRYDGWDQVYRTEVPADLYPTSYITERTIDHLERLARDDRGFLVFCSFPDPHHPFTPPGRYWDLFEPQEMRLPATFHDAHTHSPPHLRAIAERRGELPIDPTLTWAPTEGQLQHALAAELGSLSMIDDGIGQILGALERLELDEATNVIFMSDHGDMFGEHGLMLKHFVHYESVVRVPLIVRAPGRERRSVESLVSSADIAPTVLDLAGLPPYRGIQGRSLVPLLDGRALTLRERLLIEEDQPFGIDGLPGPVRIRTLVTEDAKLTVYGGRDFGQLYDLREDAEELVNLYSEPDAGALRTRLYEATAEELMFLPDPGVNPVASA